MEENKEIKKDKEKKIKVPESLLEKLYNRENKELFLEQYLKDESTREMYTVYLNQASEWENIIKKDLFEFSEKDVENMFANAYTTKASSLRALFSTSKQYLNWATNISFLNRTGENPFETLDFKKDILPMLNLKNISKSYITEEEVWAIGNDKRTINKQDYICIILPFYGIKGQLCSEIVNLKREDVDGVYNTITLVNKIIYEDPKAETKVVKDIIRRTIPISKELIKIIEDADDQEEYNRRGEAGFGGRVTAQLNMKSEFVVKGTLKNNFQISAQSVANRAKKNLKSVGYEHMSINDLVVSGKISALRKIEESKGFLEINDYKLIQDRFGEDMTNYANIKLTYENYMEAISKAD